MIPNFEQEAERLQSHLLGMGGIVSGPEWIATITQALRAAYEKGFKDCGNAEFLARKMELGYHKGFEAAREAAAEAAVSECPHADEGASCACTEIYEKIRNLTPEGTKG